MVTLLDNAITRPDSPIPKNFVSSIPIRPVNPLSCIHEKPDIFWRLSVLEEKIKENRKILTEISTNINKLTTDVNLLTTDCT